MIKDNHITAAGGIATAIALVRAQMPYPLTLEVETENLTQVEEALTHGADIIMLDNMPTAVMKEAVVLIRQKSDRVKIEASGNVTLKTLEAIAQTGVDYISSSAPITRSPWMDISMRF
jgi:nicotinate-nucleotide pyrophosphorylase (carboxylating)